MEYRVIDWSSWGNQIPEMAVVGAVLFAALFTKMTIDWIRRRGR